MTDGGGVFVDLRAAFAAEAATVQRYSYFATVAEIEGYAAVAKLFTDLAESLTCAAHGHIDFLQRVADPSTGSPIGDTQLNLVAAVAGEMQDATDLYPRVVRAAYGEGLADVASWGQALCALKRAHVVKLQDALAAFVAPSPSIRESLAEPVEVTPVEVTPVEVAEGA